MAEASLWRGCRAFRRGLCLTSSSFTIQYPAILSCNRLEDNAVDDAQEDDRCVQSSQYVVDAHLRPDMTPLLPEYETAMRAFLQPSFL